MAIFSSSSFLVVLLLGIDITYGLMSEAQIQASQKLIKRACKSKAKITSDDELDGMLKGNWDNLSPSTLCYLNCCLQMFKLTKNDGHVDYESALKQTATLQPERRAACEISITKCKDAGESLTNKCEIGYEVAKCLYFDNPENYLIP